MGSLVCCAFAVDSDVIDFLSHYGYYQQQNAFSGHTLTDAILKYQRFNHLPETGVVDDVTKKEMAKPRCGVTDISGNSFFGYVSKWEKNSFTYKFLNYDIPIEKSDIEKTVEKAFEMWSSVANLQFRRVSNDDVSDIRIGQWKLIFWLP